MLVPTIIIVVSRLVITLADGATETVGAQQEHFGISNATSTEEDIFHSSEDCESETDIENSTAVSSTNEFANYSEKNVGEENSTTISSTNEFAIILEKKEGEENYTTVSSTNKFANYSEQKVGKDTIFCDKPPVFEGSQPPRMSSKNAIGTLALYRCDFGYVSRDSGGFRSVCELDESTGEAKWTNPNVVCIPRSCGDPGFVPNAQRVGSLFTFPNKVEFRCYEGYKISGTPGRYCHASGEWSGKLPTCNQIYCKPPTNPENGQVKYKSLEYGSELSYECNKGYALNNKTTRFCNEDGAWSDSEPICIEASCDIPEAPVHGNVRLTAALKVDSIALFTCNEGKTLDGASASKCLVTGQWTFPTPKCLSSCFLHNIDNGRIGQFKEVRVSRYNNQQQFVEYQFGAVVKPKESVTLLCNDDFIAVERGKASEGFRSSEEIVCDDGNWSKDLQCISALCLGDAPPIDNGYPEYKKRIHGQVISYKCNKYYVKARSGHIKCVYGNWTGYTPICVDGRCYMNQLNVSGLFIPKLEFMEHSRFLAVRCNEGYTKVNNNVIKVACNKGQWNVPKETCIENDCVGEPPGIDNGRPKWFTRKPNSEVEYECSEHFELRGSSSVRCIAGEWTGKAPTCFSDYCFGEPPQIDNVKQIWFTRHPNSKVEYECNEHFRLTPPSSVRCFSGNWTGQAPTCVGEDCLDAPPGIDNGRMKSFTRNHNSEVEYECNGSFQLTGFSSVRCLAGKWTGQAPTCVGGDCLGDPPRIHNGRPKWIPRSPGSQVEYECDKHFLLKGSSSVRCVNGKWTGESPTCIAETTEECNQNQFRCVNGRCIDRILRCNDYRDCTDNSDEYNCEYNVCREDEFRCSAGQCIKSTLKCNGEEDCRDRSDEYGCESNVCREDEFKCSAGQCIKSTLKCNGEADCQDRSDEYGCGEHSHFHYTMTTDAPNFTLSKSEETGSTRHVSTITPSTRVWDEHFPGKPDICSCGYQNDDPYLYAYVGTKKLQNGDLVKRGSKVLLSCRSEKHNILNWQNGLRVCGNANMSCDVCKTWRASDLPRCGDRYSGDSYIVLNEKTNVVPGGSIEVQAKTWNDIHCVNINDRYPKWDAHSEEYLQTYYFTMVETSTSYFTVLRVPELSPGISKLYQCSAKDHYERTFVPTVLHIQVRASNIRCPELDGGKMFSINYSEDRKVNSLARYFCKNKTQGVLGTNTKVCLENGRWSHADLICKDITCPVLSGDKQLEISYTNRRQIGSIVTFHCSAPAVLVGRSTTQCLGNGTWDHPQPTCEDRCPLFENTYGLQVSYTSTNRVLSFATFECQSPLCLYGNFTSFCRYGGQWSHPPPVCQDIFCPEFEFTYGLKVMYSAKNQAGSFATFHCEHRTTLRGKSYSYCRCNGTWSNPQPVCEEPEIHCQQLDERDIFNIVYSNGLKLNSTARFSCKDENQIINGSDTMICQRTGQWSENYPVCVAAGCLIGVLAENLAQPVVPNMNGVTEELIPIGSDIPLHCGEENTILIGSSKATCGSLGIWEYGKPECVLGCYLKMGDALSPLIIDPKKQHYRFGEFAMFSCPPGHRLSSQVVRILCMGGTWSDSAPDCVEDGEVEGNKSDPSMNGENDSKIDKDRDEVAGNEESENVNEGNSNKEDDSTNVNTGLKEDTVLNNIPAQ